jgi:hypothetical protein
VCRAVVGWIGIVTLKINTIYDTYKKAYVIGWDQKTAVPTKAKLMEH